MKTKLQREQIGKKAAYVGIFGNILLTTFNFIVGMLSGSTALIAEAAHTLSDILTSIIAFIGFKLGMKPSTEDHPYGYGRAEPIAGLIIVVFLLIVAYEILSEVYIKLTIGSTLHAPEPIAALMALAGIGINFAMTTYIMKAGKKIDSPALIADAHHQKVDIYSCAAIFIGVVGAQLGFPILDPIIALFISILVLKTAFHIARENIGNLLGKIPSKDILNDIKSAALSISGIYGVHSLKVNYIGSYASTELYVEANNNLTLKEAHKLAHMVENSIINNVNIIKSANVHVCPQDACNEL
ncbi:MAG: cation transporter [Methanobacterium sp.]|uniref:cation diffusion facilitator family transporter n=1 Tax=Methanobacterium sp. TaxID=2164 RepID=UPI003D650036|nr:cation transporter [Methanobacterium sp.]